MKCLGCHFGPFNSKPEKKVKLLTFMQCLCNCPCCLWLMKIIFFFFPVHAAVIAINEAIEKGIAEQTIKTLRNPNAVLTLVDDSLAQEYQKELWEAKKRKEENARLKVFNKILSNMALSGRFEKALMLPVIILNHLAVVSIAIGSWLGCSVRVKTDHALRKEKRFPFVLILTGYKG